MKANKKLPKWDCAECGWSTQTEYPPVKCPQCKQTWQTFSGKHEKTGTNKWKCMVCGYIHTGEAPPATCPKCGAGYDEFTQLK